MSWLAGNPLTAPPAADADWGRLLNYYRTTHTLPVAATDDLSSAVLTMTTAVEGKRIVMDMLASLPDAAVPMDVRELVARLGDAPFPTWEPVPQALCRCDGNFRNFVVGPLGWASVDWEYRGLEDPALELAEVVTHVSMLPATAARAWQLIDQYAAMLDDASIAERAGVYMRIMLVWWVVRLTRLLYEGPRDLDVRLADRSPGWETEMIANRQPYLELATAALDGSI